MTGRRATIFLMLAAMAAACPTGDPEDQDRGQGAVDNKPATTEIETHTLPTPVATDPDEGGDIASTTAEDTSLPPPPSPPLEDTCYETYTDEILYPA